MNPYKRQSIQKLIIDQAGTERLILNDLILGRDGAQTLAQLIPQYHSNLVHLQIKGNNIDSQGFEMILIALMNCPNLTTLQAQWNNIGSSPAGLMAFLHLVQNLRFLELVDLKNNKITHHSAEIIAQIIKTNNKSLKVLDLRWNDLGEVGAQTIYPSIAFNSALKYIGLQDNRISSNTLLQITQYLKNPTRGSLNHSSGLANQTHFNQTVTGNYFPISDQAYPSMEVQMKSGQLRTKIQNEQQQTILQQQKVQVDIQKVLQKIRVKGSQIHQAQLRYDSLTNENINLVSNIRESQRMVVIVKQKFFGIDKSLSSDKSTMRTEKYHITSKMQVVMEKTIQRHQRQLQDLNSVMAQKHQRLTSYLKDLLNDKRANRQKLSQLKEDILRFKLSKESTWDKATLSATTANKQAWEEECLVLQDLIGKAETGVKSQRKKGQYLTEQLTNLVMRGLKKQQKCQKQIFDIQSKIKNLHKQMTLANVEIQESQCKITLKDAEIIEKEATVDLSRRYIKYIQSQNSVNLDIERFKNDQDSKADRFTEQTFELRITDLERAVRQQQTQNKMVKNHYEKMLAQLQAATKSTIHTVLFQG